MKRRKVTYGVYNIVEWHASLKMGKATVKVAFTGGAITTNGVTPATYTTNDPVVQLAIERSNEFRNGKIKVVRSYDLGGEVKIERNPVVAKKHVVEKCENNTLAMSPAADSGNVYLKIDGDVIEGHLMPNNPDTDSISEAVAVSDEQEDTTEESDGERPKVLTKVEVHCNDDAKDYLESQFGVKRSILLNRATIQTIAAQHNVEFIFV